MGRQGSERDAQRPVDEFGRLAVPAQSLRTRCSRTARSRSRSRWDSIPRACWAISTAVATASSVLPWRSSIWLSMARRWTRPRSWAGVSTAAAACSRALTRSPRLSRASATWTLTSPGWT